MMESIELSLNTEDCTIPGKITTSSALGSFSLKVIFGLRYLFWLETTFLSEVIQPEF